MSHAYAPTAVKLPATVTMTDDGDARTAASVNTPLETIANGVKFLTGHDGLVNVILPANVGFIWESNGVQAAPAYNNGTFWPVIGGATTSLAMAGAAGNGAVTLNRVNNASTSCYGYRFGIDQYLVDGATIASCVMRFAGNSMFVASGLLPAVMPKFAIVRYTADGVISSLLAAGMVSDSSPNGATYGAIHSVTFTPDQNALVDKSTYSYAILLWTEAHTNALQGEILYSFKVTQT